ncbi:MAG: sulfatase family protein [Chloroflexota bacterium]
MELLKRPNVVYIDCHDLGTWLGCYGRPYVRTPHLDRLAAQGAVFDHYIAAAPICMPSRAAAFTGCLPHQSGVFGQDPLNGAHLCLPEYFRRAGYETVLSGGLMIPNDPASVGFERVLPARGDDERAAAAAAFLAERGRSAGRPFYLSVSFQHVHRPFGPSYDPAVAATIPVPPPLPDLPIVRQDLASLARKVEELDNLVGQIVDALDRTALADDTVVLFTTEHGPAIARAKHTLYDAGLRIALLLRYPRAVRAGTRRGELLSNVDLLPTMLALAGLPAPAGILGASFAALLNGGTSAQREAVFAEHSWGRRSGRYYYTPARCVRSERYKYIRNFTRQPAYVDNGWMARFAANRAAVEAAAQVFAAPAPADELYDLRSDPHELRNLAADPTYAPLLERLRACLHAFLRETDDPILRGPVPNSDNAPDSPQWVEQPDGTFRLAATEPLVEREQPFPAEGGGTG